MELRTDHQAARNGVQNVAEDDGHAGAGARLRQHGGGFGPAEVLKVAAGHPRPTRRVWTALGEIFQRPIINWRRPCSV